MPVLTVMVVAGPGVPAGTALIARVEIEDRTGGNIFYASGFHNVVLAYTPPTNDKRNITITVKAPGCKRIVMDHIGLPSGATKSWTVKLYPK